MYETRSTEKASMTNFKLTHNVFPFNKICGFGKVILE